MINDKLGERVHDCEHYIPPSPKATVQVFIVDSVRWEFLIVRYETREVEEIYKNEWRTSCKRCTSRKMNAEFMWKPKRALILCVVTMLMAIHCESNPSPEWKVLLICYKIRIISIPTWLDSISKVTTNVAVLVKTKLQSSHVD